jgi:ATP/maltotriose-dependent transcriptional regulator MalT
VVAVIGREAELRAVERFLDGVSTDPAALVIEGEAGIGKTTVWLEAVRGAEGRSFRVLRARPAESEAKLSYAVLADLVGDAFDEVRAALPVPQERALAAALLQADSEEPADARTTATALVNVLTLLAAERPVLVAIDDVQWVDPASQWALEFALRRSPSQLGLVLTRRAEGGDDPPLGLGRSFSEDRVTRLELDPLSLAALHHLVKRRFGTLPRPMLVRLAGASGGNPFFALEIARALARDGDDRSLSTPLPVPRSLRELVAARIDALSAVAREAVLVAAAASHPTVAIVEGSLAEEVDAGAALIEAEEAGVLVLEDGRIRFTHPLLASVLYGSASRERRRQLHERLATLVANPEERARHLARSATAPDEATAAEVEQAARQAALRGAQHAAAELFAAAGRLTPAELLEERTRRMLGEASALLALGDVEGARRLTERAVSSSPVALVRAQALSLLGHITFRDGTPTLARDHAQRALTEAQADRHLTVAIHAQLVAFNVPQDPHRAIEHADAAMRLAGTEGDPALLGDVVIRRFWAEVLLGRGAQRELLARGLELEASAGPAARRSPLPLIWFHCTDDFEAARARHALEDGWYRERGEEGWRAERLAHLALAELWAGRWDLAEQYVDQSCGVIEQLDTHGPWMVPFNIRSRIDAHRGRIDRARATLQPFLEETNSAEMSFWAALLLSTLGFVEFAAGEHAASDRALKQMWERVEATGVRDFLPDRSEPCHVESLLALGELDRARVVLERLQERGRILPRPWITAALPRARALVLAAEGEVEAALAALEELDVDVASMMPFEHGQTLLVRGRLYRRAKQKRSAADALRRALDIFERLGAPTWVEQTRSELGRVSPPRVPDGLTPSELRVAELAAAGLTNREVGAAAFMSPKTVEANLARVYRKLGIRSRAELGARMAERRNIETHK